MLAAIATLTAKEGAVDDLLAVGQELAAAVAANEPGVVQALLDTILSWRRPAP